LSLAFPFLSPLHWFLCDMRILNLPQKKRLIVVPALHLGVCHHPPNPFKHAGPKSTNKAKILVVTGRW
jgi:hypothetical protein